MGTFGKHAPSRSSRRTTRPPNSAAGMVLHAPSVELNISHLLKLESLLITDDRVTKRLTRAEALVDKYRHKRRRIQERIFVERAAISAVRWVPVEIWEHIFSIAATIDPDQVPVIGRVCTTWRNVSLQPKFWRNLIISKEGHRQVDKVRLFDKYSTERWGVSQVTYVQPSDLENPRHWGAWNQLGLFADTSLKSLDVTFNNTATACHALPSIGPMSNLTNLSLAIRGRNPGTIDEENCGFHYYDKTTLPSIRSLTLAIFMIPWPSDFLSNLTSLHIIDNFSTIVDNTHQLHPMRGGNIIEFLHSCEALQEFTLDAKGSYLSFTQMELDDAGWPPLKLDFLRRLVLQCHYSIGHAFMRHLKAFQSLQSATLRFYPRQLTQSDYALSRDTMAFGFEHKELRSLTLHGMDVTVPTSIGVLGFEHLEELRLEHSPDFETFGCRYRRMQSVQIHRPIPFWIAPRLSRLILIAYPGDIPFDTMADVIMERYIANASKGTPARIEHFEVNGQDMLKDAAPGKIVEYYRPKHFQFVKKKQSVP